MAPRSVAAPPPWRARLATTALFFANGFGVGGWAAAIPLIKSRLALSDAQLSVPLFAMAAGAILLMPSTGFLAHRFGAGRALRGGAIGFGVVLGLIGLAPNLPLLVAATFLLGAFSGLMDVRMNAHATLVERRWGAAIMSSFHAAWSGGGLAGAALGGLLMKAGAPAPWLFAVTAGAVLAVVVGSAPHIGGAEAAAEGWAFVWPQRRLAGLCLVALFGMLTEGAMADWCAVYLTGVVGVAPAVAASGYAAFAAAMLLGRLSGDVAVRRLGRTEIIMLGGGLAAAGVLLAVAAPSPITAIGGFFLVGLGLSNLIPAVFSASAALASSPALGIAMTATVGYAGFLIGPPLIGSVASFAGLRVSFALLVAAALAIAPLAAASRRSSGAAG
ncbi:MAG: MFS transporter [Roseiarcus sp.]|jgi:MFS family permease